LTTPRSVMDAPSLVFRAHGAALRLLSGDAGRHFTGLGQACRAYRNLTQRTKRRLTHLDSAAALLRHITQVGVDEFLVELENEIAAMAPTDRTPRAPTPSRSVAGATPAAQVPVGFAPPGTEPGTPGVDPMLFGGTAPDAFSGGGGEGAKLDARMFDLRADIAEGMATLVAEKKRLDAYREQLQEMVAQVRRGVQSSFEATQRNAVIADDGEDVPGTVQAPAASALEPGGRRVRFAQVVEECTFPAPTGSSPDLAAPAVGCGVGVGSPPRRLRRSTAVHADFESPELHEARAALCALD